MLTPETQAAMERLAVVPRADDLKAQILDRSWKYQGDAAPNVKREDLAPAMVERLRYLYTEILEDEHADLPAANGQVFPIDDSVPPGAVEWRSETVTQTGFAQFIDEDGNLSPNGSAIYGQQTGRLHNIGRAYEFNTFHLENAAYAKIPIESMRGREAKRSIDALTHWTWLFGDTARGLQGCFTHRNVPIILAPLNGGSSSRLWSAKSDAEIAADINLLVDAIRSQTSRKESAAIVYMGENLYKLCRRRLLGQTSGLLVTLMDWIESQHKGDKTGAGAIEFRIFNECEAAFRRNPETDTDTSGISGDFLFALPAMDKRKDAFMRARRLTQLPPEQRRFVIEHAMHAKIGGWRTERPLAFAMLKFVA